MPTCRLDLGFWSNGEPLPWAILSGQGLPPLDTTATKLSSQLVNFSAGLDLQVLPDANPMGTRPCPPVTPAVTPSCTTAAHLTGYSTITPPSATSTPCLPSLSEHVPAQHLKFHKRISSLHSKEFTVKAYALTHGWQKLFSQFLLGRLLTQKSQLPQLIKNSIARNKTCRTLPI